ncbi:MAG: hypothetical protein M0Q14_00960 [Tissierellaceae bacterium]|nr:hypothetical protein [Tissierellaceae bacterium]
MTYRLCHKRIIFLLMVTLIVLGGFLWYKEQTTNKTIPKMADFVFKSTGGLMDAERKGISYD